MADTTWAPFGEPPSVTLAGESGDGKSTAMLRLAAHRGLFIAPRGELRPAQGVLGVTLAPWQVRNVRHLGEVLALFRELRKASPKVRGRYRWVVVDNLGRLADRYMPTVDKRVAAAAAEANANVNKYARWLLLMELLKELYGTAQDLDLGVGFTSGIREPNTDDEGMYHRGGPWFPARTRTRDLAQISDLIGRTEREPGTQPYPLWDGVLCTNDSPNDYYGRDRHGWAPPRGPLNPAEVLRGAGFDIPRPEPLAWAEPLVEHIATELLGGVELRTLARRVIPRLRVKHATTPADTLTSHIIWILQDASDRATLRRMRAGRLDDLLNDNASAAKTLL